MIQAPVQQRSQKNRERCRQPQLGDGPRIRHPEQPVHDDGCGPLAGQPWAGRGAEHREIVHQVFEAFRLGQPLGPEKAQGHQHDHHRAGGHQAQKLPGPPGREDVDQDQGEGRTHHRRKDQVGNEGRERHDRKEKPAAEHDPVGRKDRQRQQRHHPGGVDHRLHQLGGVEP